MPLLAEYSPLYPGWSPKEVNQAIIARTWSRSELTECLAMNILFAEITPTSVWKAIAWERIGKTFEAVGSASLAGEAYAQAVGHNPRNTDAQAALEQLGVKKGPRAHPAYHQEVAHLTMVVNAIDGSLRAAAGSFPESAAADRYAARGLTEMRRQQVGRLEQARWEPYFGRFDIRHENAEGKYYIGKFGAPGVTDWKAPVANLFYEGTGGETSYTAPEGQISVCLKLIRRLIIQDGCLLDMVDTLTEDSIRRTLAGGRDEWADEFLIEQLERSAGEELKDIVATIQREQNRVIRAPLSQVVVVQGVAGSGKTTVALHRVAYLLYTYPELIHPEQVLVVAPNQLFLQYVERLLPNLGINGVVQTTFTDWGLSLLRPNVKLRKGSLGGPGGWLASVELPRVIDAWLYRFGARLLPHAGLALSDSATVSAEEIHHWYMNEFAAWPVAVRFERIRQRLKAWAAREAARTQTAARQPFDVALAELERDKDSPEREDRRQILEGRDLAIEQARTAVDRALQDYLALLPGASIYLRAWAEFLLSPDGALRIAPEELKPLLTEAARHASLGVIAEEELPALLYIHDWLYGSPEKERYHHVVVDEAQDLNPLHYAVLASRSRQASFTIVGDLAQAIHTGAGTWADVLGSTFEPERVNEYSFVKSYRSTREIVGVARAVLERADHELPLPEPVLRSGSAPDLRSFASEADLIRALVPRVKEWAERHTTVAVLVPTPERALEVQRAASAWGLDLAVVTGPEHAKGHGPVVVPVTLAKGLEFDAVLVLDANRDHYPETPLAVRCLYVALTRPLHELAVFWVGPVSPLLVGPSGSGTPIP